MCNPIVCRCARVGICRGVEAPPGVLVLLAQGLGTGLGWVDGAAVVHRGAQASKGGYAWARVTMAIEDRTRPKEALVDEELSQQGVWGEDDGEGCARMERKLGNGSVRQGEAAGQGAPLVHA